jgi:hypothetical protein
MVPRIIVIDAYAEPNRPNLSLNSWSGRLALLGWPLTGEVHVVGKRGAANGYHPRVESDSEFALEESARMR